MNIKKLNITDWENLKTKVNKLDTLSKYELIPIYTNQKSFNKKAFIIFKPGFEILESYQNIIFIKDNTNLYYNLLEHSTTTTKHIKEYLKEYNTFLDININDNIKDIKKKFAELENINAKLAEINKYYLLDITTFDIENHRYIIFNAESYFESYIFKKDIIKDLTYKFNKILNYLNINNNYLEVSIRHNKYSNKEVININF